MAEPTSMAVAATVAGASSLAVLATTLGVPAPVVLASVLGATISVSQSSKMEWNWGGVTAALLSFAASLGIGIWGGALLGHLLVGFINSLIHEASVQLQSGQADPLATLLLSMVGQRELLPVAVRALANLFGRIGGGGASQ